MSTTTAPSELAATTPSTGGSGDLLPVVAACCAPSSTVSDRSAAELAKAFKALADPARVKILSMLLNSDEVCACEFSAGIGKTPATTSHHLKLLREVGLVATQKRGTWVWYRVVPERLAAIRDALAFR
jgi:ArsR family transcriptional regulator, arsenate/arsenite/antimonite-responsive transcriptional repressor